ncbi:hypothetical protein HK097_001710 [Rhizophlyctis rosea]|uniref:Uncharacterized protein n=1 Tax=Rhizophlyctis rosea TaxID=64517 RepID=A0AAD5S444_9FUNG|nr:hypothetical protein HK097_001710 [Rhizophlyctis rosea]
MKSQPDDPDVFLTKAEISIHKVRSLVSSWLPPPTAADRKADEEAAKRASQSELSLYATNRETSRRNASALHRSIAGTKSSIGLSDAGVSAKPPNKYATIKKSTTSKKQEDSESEEERKGESKKNGKGGGIGVGVGGGGGGGGGKGGKKRTADVLSEYLDKSGKKKKKKKKSAGGDA